MKNANETIGHKRGDVVKESFIEEYKIDIFGPRTGYVNGANSGWKIHDGKRNAENQTKYVDSPLTHGIFAKYVSKDKRTQYIMGNDDIDRKIFTQTLQELTKVLESEPIKTYSVSKKGAFFGTTGAIIGSVFAASFEGEVNMVYPVLTAVTGFLFGVGLDYHDFDRTKYQMHEGMPELLKEKFRLDLIMNQEMNYSLGEITQCMEIIMNRNYKQGPINHQGIEEVMGTVRESNKLIKSFNDKLVYLRNPFVN